MASRLSSFREGGRYTRVLEYTLVKGCRSRHVPGQDLPVSLSSVQRHPMSSTRVGGQADTSGKYDSRTEDRIHHVQ